MIGLSLFSGIGGLDLAAEAAGIEITAFCEIEPFCQKILQKQWPHIHIHPDVREIRGDDFGAIDIIYGGFPCQPVSIAGKQRKEDDSRWLWPEFARIIAEVKPAWVLAENVENAVRTVLDSVLVDLENLGYEAGAYCTQAYCSGAWFAGARIFIVAASNDRCPSLRWNAQFSINAASQGRRGNYGRRTPVFDSGERWKKQPRPIGVADGVSARLDRLRALGNAVVPPQVYPFFRAIALLDALAKQEVA